MTHCRSAVWKPLRRQYHVGFDMMAPALLCSMALAAASLSLQELLAGATMAALRKAQSSQVSPSRVQQQHASQMHALKQQCQHRVDQLQGRLDAVFTQLQQVGAVTHLLSLVSCSVGMLLSRPAAGGRTCSEAGCRRPGDSCLEGGCMRTVNS